MNLQKQLLATIRNQAKLSALWMVFLFNIVFRDIHELVKPGFIEEIMTGTLNGNPIQEHMLLIGGIVIQGPIMMILLSWLLSYRANRWTNIIVAAMYIPILLVNSPTDLDDTFHMLVEIAALLFVIWSAWHWRGTSAQPDTTQHHATSHYTSIPPQQN